MKHLFTLVCLSFFVMSCSVTESIVFNEHMGGVYKSTFDMSQIMTMFNESNFSGDEQIPSKAVDTTIVFNQFLEQNKDSISTLPLDQQKQLYDLKDVVIDMRMDEDNSVFNFAVNRPFIDITELKQINEQLDGAMQIAQAMSGKEELALPGSEDQDGITKSDPVFYGFSNNTFTRVQLKKETVSEASNNDTSAGSEDSLKDLGDQLGELFKATFYTMTYTFPKAIKSVSYKDVTFSEDRKTVTLKTDLNALNKDSDLMNLEIILED